MWCEEHQVSHPNPLRNSGYYPRDFNEPLSQHPWNQAPRDPNKMRVFGDGDIKLCQKLLTLSARDNNNNPLYPAFTIDGQTEYSGSRYVVSKIYSFNANDIPNYDFSHLTYGSTSFYTRPANILINSAGTVTAHYNWNPTYYTLSISSSGGGHTNPTGDQQCLRATNFSLFLTERLSRPSGEYE